MRPLQHKYALISLKWEVILFSIQIQLHTAKSVMEYFVFASLSLSRNHKIDLPLNIKLWASWRSWSDITLVPVATLW